MRVKPWATADETLDALHAVLASRRSDAEFWKGLEDLLETLSRDMRRRLSEGAVENEVLDPASRHRLLEEIRRALPCTAETTGAFRRLAQALSAPAAGLLVLLGGVATVGCESSTALRGHADAAADVELDVPDAVDHGSEDTYVDPITDPAEPDTGCEHAGMALGEIIDECITYEGSRIFYHACLDALHESWTTGLSEYFQCQPCSEVEFLLSCLTGNEDFCSRPELAGEYDLETLLDNCMVVLYVGVRFE